MLILLAQILHKHVLTLLKGSEKIAVVAENGQSVCTVICSLVYCYKVTFLGSVYSIYGIL